MGREIIRVPVNFQHPVDKDGGYIPGAHYFALHKTAPPARTGWQVYENVSEGTPVSPIFNSVTALEEWLLSQGMSPALAKTFIQDGHVPSSAVWNLPTGLWPDKS